MDSGDSDNQDPQEAVDGVSPKPMWVLVLLLGMILAGGLAFTLLKPDLGPPPVDIANDPLLVEGRRLYLERCASCHGETGIGDGPVAKINEVPPGNLADDTWKYGDQPETVVKVIGEGILGAMPGWDKTFRESEIAAVAAYVYVLAGRDVPESLRSGETAQDQPVLE